MAVYAVADLHGQLDLLRQIQNFLSPNDIVYCLGDCGDRGPEPWKTIKEVFKDDRFIYLMGNHEKMLIDAIEEVRRDEAPGEKYSLLCMNGGERTFDEWYFETYANDWYKKLRDLPYKAEYDNKDGYKILMSHAGYTPGTFTTNKDLIWDRKHCFNKWPFDADKIIILHGHTPIPYLIKDFRFWNKDLVDEGGAFWYCGNHKIDIDRGAVSCGKTILFDLDSFDEHIFIAK